MKYERNLPKTLISMLNIKQMGSEKGIYLVLQSAHSLLSGSLTSPSNICIHSQQKQTKENGKEKMLLASHDAQEDKKTHCQNVMIQNPKGVGKNGTLVCLAWSSLETEAFPLMFAKPSPRFLLLSQSEGRAKKESKWVEKIWFKRGS